MGIFPQISSQSHNGDHSLDLAIQFGRNLERWRRERGMSPAALAARAEIDLEEVQKLQAGRGGLPDVEVLVHLAGALEVSPEALLEGFEVSD